MDHLEPIFAVQLPSALVGRSVAPSTAEFTPQSASRQTAEYGCVDWFPYLPTLANQGSWFGHDGSVAIVE